MIVSKVKQRDVNLANRPSDQVYTHDRYYTLPASKYVAFPRGALRVQLGYQKRTLPVRVIVT